MSLLRNKRHKYDPLWHVQIIMAVTIALQLMLPERFIFGTPWLVPAVEVILMLALVFSTPKQKIFSSLTRRLFAVALIAVTALSNVYVLAEVANHLLEHGTISNGRELILTAINIYLTNIVVFALLYWEMDAGGPGRRRAVTVQERDFLFPQSQVAGLEQWHPTFIDYLYLSSTNTTAFSPTDTLPLSRRAKMLMLLQAMVALITVALVAARAVNILN